MKEGRYARKPLFYIEQPNMSAPKAEMQESYRSGQKRKKQQKTEQPSPKVEKELTRNEKKQKQHQNEKNIFHEQLLGGKRSQQKTMKEKHEEKTEEPADIEPIESKLELVNEQETLASEDQLEPIIEENTETAVENIPFNKLDIKGKVNYFINKPTLMPDMKCEVRTADHVHYGVIDDLQDEIVQIRKKKQMNPELVPITEIKSIRILGF